MSPVEQSLSSQGTWRKFQADAVEQLARLHRRVLAEIANAVGDVKGPAAVGVLQAHGLEMLHTAIDPLDVGPIRDRVLERLRGELLEAAVYVGRSVMGWDGEFYVDDYLILRINLPYEVAKHASAAAENPGIGRVSASMRELAAARRVRDPVYDPKSYHRGHPPAAWAHGAHRDSWAGHSKDGLNVWWAISDVPADAGVVFYPELTGETVECDPRTLYLRSGHALAAPTFVPLAAGEMLIFDPEILHGTHLNVTNQTRIALSLRLNARKPAFDPACFYAREFWRRASDIEARELDTVLHLKREEHVAPCATSLWRARCSPVRIVNVRRGEGEPVVEVGPSSLVPEGEKIVAALPDRRVVLMRLCGRMRAVDAACPHYGVDLSDGGADGRTLYCPACAVGFDIESGRSAAPSLTLKTYAVGDDDGTIRLDLSD